MTCYAMLPHKLYISPSKLSPPFLTEMAKKARTAQILIRIPPVVAAAPSSCFQFETIAQ